MQKTDIMTADELFEMEDDYEYELIQGSLVRISPPGFEHRSIGATVI